MKKIISLILAVSIVGMTLLTMPIMALASDSGECGVNAKWTFDNGVLTISGSGDMYDYSDGRTPFTVYNGQVKKIVIEDGITKIGDNALFYLGNVDEIIIPKSVRELGLTAFAFDIANTVYYNAENCKFVGNSTGMAYNYFPQGKTLIIGKDVKQIGGYVFYRANFGQTTYDTVKYEGSAEEWGKIKINYTGNDVLGSVIFASDENKVSSEINVLINNKFLQCDQPPVLINGRTLVPMRAIFEALGAEVNWNSDKRTAEGIKEDKKVAITIEDNALYVNGVAKELDVPAQLINGKTMVPVRAISEAFDCNVQWNGAKKYVIIRQKNQVPLNISVLNKNEDVVAEAHFDTLGRITSLSGSQLSYLCPFYINIDGNTYEDHMFKNISIDTNFDFIYDDSGLLGKIRLTSGGETREYSYTYENGVYIKYSGYGVTDYKYDGNICTIGEAKTEFNPDGTMEVIARADSYIFNDKGLLDTYRFFSSFFPGGYGERIYKYNESGMLVSEYSTGTKTLYDYNEYGDILTARTNYGSHEIVYTYRYSEDIGK